MGYFRMDAAAVIMEELADPGDSLRRLIAHCFHLLLGRLRPNTPAPKERDHILEAFLQQGKAFIDGRINLATARVEVMLALRRQGWTIYTDITPDTRPISERARLWNRPGSSRIDLVLTTLTGLCYGHWRHQSGLEDYALYTYPAWELLRLGTREYPRGFPGSGTVGWPQRWKDAAAEVLGDGVSKKGMMALKSSPIWQALANGAGGYEDTLGYPHPPFAFGSSMTWRDVTSKECREAGLPTPPPSPALQANFDASSKAVRRAVDSLPREVRAELFRELGITDE